MLIRIYLERKLSYTLILLVIFPIFLQCSLLNFYLILFSISYLVIESSFWDNFVFFFHLLPEFNQYSFHFFLTGFCFVPLSLFIFNFWFIPNTDKEDLKEARGPITWLSVKARAGQREQHLQRPSGKYEPGLSEAHQSGHPDWKRRSSGLFLLCVGHCFKGFYDINLFCLCNNLRAGYDY